MHFKMIACSLMFLPFWIFAFVYFVATGTAFRWPSISNLRRVVGNEIVVKQLNMMTRFFSLLLFFLSSSFPMFTVRPVGNSSRPFQLTMMHRGSSFSSSVARCTCTQSRNNNCFQFYFIFTITYLRRRIFERMKIWKAISIIKETR